MIMHVYDTVYEILCAFTKSQTVGRKIKGENNQQNHYVFCDENFFEVITPNFFFVSNSLPEELFQPLEITFVKPRPFPATKHAS